MVIRDLQSWKGMLTLLNTTTPLVRIWIFSPRRDARIAHHCTSSCQEAPATLKYSGYRGSPVLESILISLVAANPLARKTDHYEVKYFCVTAMVQKLFYMWGQLDVQGTKMFYRIYSRVEV